MLQLQETEFQHWLEANFKDLEQPPALHPPRDSAAQTPASEPPSASETSSRAELQAGSFAHVVGLTKRPDLNDEVLQLVRYDPAADRWICAKGDGEQLRLRPPPQPGAGL